MVAIRLRRFQVVPLILIPPRNSHPYLLGAMTFVNRWPLTLRAPIVQEFTLLLLPRKNKVRGKKRFPTANCSFARSRAATLYARRIVLPRFTSLNGRVIVVVVKRKILYQVLFPAACVRFSIKTIVNETLSSVKSDNSTRLDLVSVAVRISYFNRITSSRDEAYIDSHNVYPSKNIERVLYPLRRRSGIEESETTKNPPPVSPRCPLS